MSDNIILVTGATGFIGKRLCHQIIQNGGTIRRALRREGNQEGAVVGELGQETNWSTALVGVKCVIHLAGRVHVMRDSADDVLAEYRRVNVLGTLNLAQQAAALGVKRLIYISSIKVNGEKTKKGVPFLVTDNPNPHGPYAVSKWEAEQRLLALSAKTGIEVVIIRPPLVYGPGVKANFLSMLRWLSRGLPMPFGAIYNKRSLVALDNLVDLIITCIRHPAAANQVFFAGDGEDLSTTELLHRLGYALGKPARLVSVPTWILQAVAGLIGKRQMGRRLCDSLQVDISKTREVLGWSPMISVNEGLQITAQYYLNNE
jgi:nucleoside-diphosphate-sugar epimerase